MKIALLKDADPNETRCALTPKSVKRLTSLGAKITIESGVGNHIHASDADYKTAGATIAKTPTTVLKGADAILTVNRPQVLQLKSMPKNTVIIGMLNPHDNTTDLKKLASAHLTSFAMELMPRITRAQTMDVLSSQANLAGYQAIIEATALYDQAVPMMITAAGTIPPAKIFVMGAGVAGLQAIATARRLGAVVSATDVRPAAKEQVESLGAKFIAVENDEFRQAETTGGYAKEMSEDYQRQQAELIASHIAKQDIVITTALIPGCPAPKLITKEMIASMRAGSVLVDLAVERGGNIDGVQADKVADIDGRNIIGYRNMAGRIAATASELYANNLVTFLETMIDTQEGKLVIDWEDELIKATLLTRGGAIVHPSFADSTPKSPRKTSRKQTT